VDGKTVGLMASFLPLKRAQKRLAHRYILSCHRDKTRNSGGTSRENRTDAPSSIQVSVIDSEERNILQAIQRRLCLNKA
jgi:hypothetical protein